MSDRTSQGIPNAPQVEAQLGLGDVLHREVDWLGPLPDVVHGSGSAIFPWYDWQTLKGVLGIDGTKPPHILCLASDDSRRTGGRPAIRGGTLSPARWISSSLRPWMRPVTRSLSQCSIRPARGRRW